MILGKSPSRPTMRGKRFTEEQIAFALKQRVADLSLDKIMLQDMIQKKL